MAIVDIRSDSEVLLLTVNNPPVNAMSQDVRSSLFDALQAASSNEGIRGVILLGAGRTFVAGADIREFGRTMSGPNSLQIYSLMEEFPKPIVAALHGTTLGGGLELAMAAHFRVALSTAELGLPEVEIGLIPGGGGTQRLPRLVGVEKAIELITGGKRIDAAQALALGILDELVPSAKLEHLPMVAIDFVRRIIAEGRSLRRVRDENQKLQNFDPDVFSRWRKVNARRWHGLLAPGKILECIESACTLSWEEANKVEHLAFEECKRSPQRAALSHLFFAERKAGKIPELTQAESHAPLQSVAVIGSGTMGSGIATVLASSGLSVRQFDTSTEALERGRQAISKNYTTSVARGLMDRARADAAMSQITSVASYDQIADCDLVIEAVFENMSVKQDVFRTLDAVMKPGAILATNTSTLDIDKIASATRRPDTVVGLHFFSPANIMKLVEVIRGARSSAQTLATAFGLVKRLGKIAVLAGNCHGFIGNRILYAYGREADFLLEEGATPWQVDKVLQDFGLPMGLYLMRDMAGLDVGWRARREQAPSRPKHLRYSSIADRICESGRLGQKTGKGYYSYQSANAEPDPEIQQLIDTVSNESGISRRPISDDDILDRVLIAMVNEGARIVGEGISRCASDIDVIYVYGYGFPRYRGGPMYWAQQRGLSNVLETVREFHRLHGEYWTPAPYLVRAAETGSWDAAHEVK
jgi:3-hydroxyacyl-CoA dehydrogenase